MAAAEQLGLLPEWIQHPGTYREHFDVTDTVRKMALQMAAESIDYPRGTAALLERKRLAQ